MRAAVSLDTTTREIIIKVVDGQIVDITKAWQTKARRIQVDRIVLWVVDHKTRSIRAFGSVMRKDGKPGLQRGSSAWSVHTIDGAPEWAQILWRDAPAGVTSWKIEETS
jgi:hypothetical protein